MGKIAFIYPGQGAQKAGMGKDFYETYPEAKQVYELADKVLDFDIKKICFEENEDINKTEYTQPALVTTCLAITECLKNKGIKPDVTAGLSLGEYAAIATAGGMKNEDAISTVRKRGIYMSNAVPQGEGTMVAVLGMTAEEVASVVEDIPGISVANYNCPGQVVITGKKAMAPLAADKLTQAGAKRTIELNVSGPFHSPFLTGAGEQLRKELDEVNFSKLTVPYVTNVDATYVENIEDTPQLLQKQVSSSVMWEQSVRNMIAQGVDTFIEIGPGKTLAGFMKKIDRSVKMI
ncbi:MAG: ACP S-malonyltransferase, partial [Lachnospiraceae bacterium]|nr:ACP S-malonyltransferase [Lachnospiraceae bacterium]